jgi:subtilisin family serine protease
VAGTHVASAAPAAKRVPRRTSMEYRLSLGLQAINAHRAYAKGTTGQGVVVAMIDTGVSSAAADLASNLSRHSTDLVQRRAAGASLDRHGNETAQVVAASLDGVGTVGVAYGATFLAIRVDLEGSCPTRCAARGADVARGIDYALAHGAKVIGVPLIGPRRLPSLEAALGRAAAAGAVVVAAAGNDGGGEPSWPARYASDPRFMNAMMVAGASTYKGQLAPWSSKAGVTQARYIAAPGHNVVVNCNTKFCNLVSGTSYSVSYVVGAIALILERHPRLDAQGAAAVLLSGARDIGRSGTDAKSGRGVLDVARALRVADQWAAMPDERLESRAAAPLG